MFDKVMTANGNSVNPPLKYTPENFDDIEKESKQNQQQFYNGEYKSILCEITLKLTLCENILELTNMFEGLGPLREGFWISKR